MASRVRLREPARDQHAAGRKARDALGRNLRRRAGIDDDMIVAARQRIDRDAQPLGHVDRGGIRADPPGRNDLHARDPVAGDDLPERRGAAHEVGNARRARVEADRSELRPVERKVDQDDACVLGKRTRQRHGGAALSRRPALRR